MWDHIYNKQGFAYRPAPNGFLKSEYFRILKGGQVLCLAEDKGRNAVFKAMQGYLSTAVSLQKAQTPVLECSLTKAADLADYDLGSANQKLTNNFRSFLANFSLRFCAACVVLQEPLFSKFAYINSSTASLSLNKYE